MSKKPSQSTSDSFQIFDNTEFGNLDLMSSDLAAKMESLEIVQIILATAYLRR